MIRLIGSLFSFAKVLTQFLREGRLISLGEEKANAKQTKKTLSNVQRAINARRNAGRVPDDQFDRDRR